MAYYGRSRDRTQEQSSEEQRTRTEASNATLIMYSQLLAEALDVDEASQETPSETMLL